MLLQHVTEGSASALATRWIETKFVRFFYHQLATPSDENLFLHDHWCASHLVVLCHVCSFLGSTLSKILSLGLCCSCSGHIQSQIDGCVNCRNQIIQCEIHQWYSEMEQGDCHRRVLTQAS